MVTKKKNKEKGYKLQTECLQKLTPAATFSIDYIF